MAAVVGLWFCRVPDESIHVDDTELEEIPTESLSPEVSSALGSVTDRSVESSVMPELDHVESVEDPENPNGDDSHVSV